jgi:hypothetical protein
MGRAPARITAARKATLMFTMATVEVMDTVTAGRY